MTDPGANSRQASGDGSQEKTGSSRTPAVDAGVSPDASGLSSPESSGLSSPESSGLSSPGFSFRFGLGELVFVVLTLCVLVSARGGILDDPGLGWHIRNIDAMIDQGNWLTTDPFCGGPTAGRPWYTNQWLGDLVFWAANRVAGLNGIAAATALVLGLTYFGLYQFLLADEVPPLPAAGWTVFAGLASYLGWMARPNAFTLGFMLVTARLCVGFHRGKFGPRTLAWVCPVLMVWANTHGSFVAGLITLGLSVMTEVALVLCSFDPDTRAAARRRLPVIAVVTLGAVLSTLANPYGWKLYAWVLNLVGDRSYLEELIYEWYSPNFHDPGAFRYEFLILVFPVVVAVAKDKPSLLELILGVAWLHFALGARRFVPFWGMVVIPTIARASVSLAWGSVARSVTSVAPVLAGVVDARPPRPGWVAVAVISAGVGGWALLAGPFAFHNPGNIPARALDRLLDLHDADPSGLVFHDPNWGGYLTWHGWPRFKTYVDDRFDVHGEAFMRKYFQTLQARGDWRARLADVRWACISPEAPLADRLAEDPEWECVYPAAGPAEPSPTKPGKRRSGAIEPEASVAKIFRRRPGK